MLSLRRVIDIIGGLAGSAVMVAVGLPLAALIKLDDGGPIFYKPERDGLGGKPFQMLKFRSMRATKNDGSNDMRVTPVGRFMRQHSLDELPQFLNVVKGDMSLFGPRPLALSEVDRLKEFGFGAAVAFRRSVRPGLAGLAQTRRRAYDPVLDRCGMHHRIDMLARDVEYIEQRAKEPQLEIKVLARTFGAIVYGHGLQNKPEPAANNEAITPQPQFQQS